jgi:type I restriction enzyme S subunit
VCAFRHGSTPSKANKAYWDGDIPWVSPKDMYADIITTSQDKITSQALWETGIAEVPEGTVLIVIRSGVLAHTLPVAIAGRPLTCNQDIKAVLPSQNILRSDYLRWLLRQQESCILSQGIKQGPTVHSIRSGFIENFKIPLPPIPEQQRIAGVLREQMSALEKARAAAQARLEAVNTLPAILLCQAFPQPGRPLPPGWRWVRLREVCRDISDGTHFTPTYVSEGIPFLSVKDVREDRLSFVDCRYITEEQHHDLCRRCKPEKGDVLYTKVGTTGIAKAIDVDLEFSIFVSVALLKLQSTVLPDYLEKVLNAPICRTQAENLTQGMANRNLVLKDLMLISIPLPSVEEQRRVEGLLAQQMAAVDKARVAAEEELETIKVLPAALLRRAFNGEL